MKLQQFSDDIWVLDHFLTPGECANLIRFSEEQGYEESFIKVQSAMKLVSGIRHSYRFIHYNNNFANQWWLKLKTYCPLDLDATLAVGIHERFRFYKYQSGHRFDRHKDTRYTRTADEKSKLSFVLYLNESFEGGVTAFDTLTITPKTGRLLYFKQNLYHEGTPVLSGTKYVIRSEVMYK